MLRKVVWILFVVALGLMTAVPVLAATPAEGVIVEGESVPGITLGFTRAQVEDAYGKPKSCQSPSQALCEFRVDGGGQVFVQYRGPDGGDANNSPADVTYNIRWYEQVSSWTTTAGVNTTLAADNAEAVIAAYPDAQVTYNQWGGIYSVVDHEQGIEVIWSPDFYAGTTHINMAIFYPRTPPPPREKTTSITDIGLTANKVKGQRQITAQVQVRDDRGYGAPGAIVYAHWMFPDGSTYAVQDTTRGSSGSFAYFVINVSHRGIYTFIIDDIVLDGYRFDLDNSLLSASSKVK